MPSSDDFLAKRAAKKKGAISDAFFSQRSAARPQSQAAPVTQQAQPATGNDTRGRMQQVAQGLTFGFSDEISAGIVATLSRLNPSERRGILDVFKEELEAERDDMALNSEGLGGVEKIALQAGGGLLSGGAIAKGVGSAVGAIRGGQAGTAAAATLANPVTSGAVEGGVAGFGASEAGDIGGNIRDTLQGAAIGGATAGLITSGGRALGAQFGEDISKTAAAVGKSVSQRADDLKIRLSPSVRTGNAAGAVGEEALQSNALTRSLFNKDIENNIDKAGRAVLSRFGKSGSKVTGEVIEGIKSDIGKQYASIAKDMADAISLAPVDVQQRDVMMSIFNEVSDSLEDVAKPGRLQKALQRTRNAMNGTKSPKIVMDTINNIRDRAAAAGRAGEIVDAEALGQLEDLLTMAAMDADPSIAPALNKARAAWRDFKVINSATVTNAATGRLNPVSMANILNRSRFTRRVFGDASDTSSVLELGRLVAQIQEVGDPNLVFGIRSGSQTASRQSFSIPNAIGNTAAAIPYVAGRAAGPANTTALAAAARRTLPRVAAIQGTREENR